MELCVDILLVSTMPHRQYRSADLPCIEGGHCGDKKLKTKKYQNQYQSLALSFSSSSLLLH